MKRLLLLGASLLLQGCSTLAYYSQAMDGHFDIMGRRESIDRIIADEARDAELRERMRTARDIRAFASRELALPDNGSYRSYAQLDRPYAVWVVFATEAFSLAPKAWCYPFVGCVSYRGYYQESDAQAFAEKLRDEGLDVFVGGTVAYSTLGWFDDPLLSTMYTRGETAVAGLVFHELAHQQLYFKADTAFNEAFATVVEEAGIRRWLDGGEAAKAFEVRQARKLQFLALLGETRARLAALFEADIPPEARHVQKAAVYARLRERYQQLKASWNGYPGYDAWFAGPLNNAKLASVAIYRDDVPAIDRWLEACEGDFERFYRAMAGFKDLTPEARRERLAGPVVCPP